jgi:signal transduction histidine kinase
MSYTPVVLPEWALLGQAPVDLSDDLRSCLLTVEPLGPGKATQKWFKKHPDLPVLVVIATTDNQIWIFEQLMFLRERLQNNQLRIICFAEEECMEGFAEQIQGWHIHRLQALQEWSDGFLRNLLMAESEAFDAIGGQRRRRESELALLTWLARTGRDESLGNKQLREVSALLTDLLGARSVLLDPYQELLGTYPAEMQGLSWQDTMNAQFDKLNLGDQPIRVQLDATLAVHEKASEVTGAHIRGSILIPFRCYDEIRGYLLILLTSEQLSRLDVGTVNLLEKTADQLRALIERRQSEQRLRVQYDRLQETLKQLYSTQEQLFHAEKLSSLGQLAAGIAHEINNPVSFVLSNFEPLDEYISGMSELIRLHDQFARTLDAGDEQLRQQLRNTIQDREKSIDLEFVLEDVFSLVSDSRNGLSRVCEIVKNLKNFAHKDQVESGEFDLVACYRDSVGILRHQLQVGIAVTENVPDKAILEGNSGMIGQVFINLIQNSIHAMSGEGTVSVEITEEAEHWVVRLSDTGPGIPDDIRTKIYDPFFTTKPVGQGTGLGLSTVYSIIERHKGSIEYKTEEGGACFEIRLPRETAS